MSASSELVSELTTSPIAVMNVAVPSGEPSNVIKAFPSTVRSQDVVINMLMAGQNMEEIAVALNTSVAQVEKAAETDWSKRTLEQRIATSSSPEGLLQNLMQNKAFKAINKLGELMECGNKNVEMTAVRTALEYNFVPAKDKGRRNGDPVKFDDLEREVKQLEEQKALLKQRTA